MVKNIASFTSTFMFSAMETVLFYLIYSYFYSCVYSDDGGGGDGGEGGGDGGFVALKYVLLRYLMYLV